MNKYATLTPDTIHILSEKGTEAPFSGKYSDTVEQGSYICRGCGAVLFRADNQFQSSCGWPSFDDEIANAIKQQTDADGRRTEILCARCDGHLGHVFSDEGITEKNLRHCVNSISIEFINDSAITDTEEAIFAGGCFWGVEYLLKKLPGVLLTEVGYTGGSAEQPSYKQVCNGQTSHVEALRVVFDPKKSSYECLLKAFMEIHDPTQKDGQGPDKGSQYLSVIFYFDDQQKKIAEKVIKILEDSGLKIATEINPASVFWPAEEYHQDYYQKNEREPYCHRRVKRF
jgi:peptide methionine sulfoxide reductase msrA/msrB